MPARTASASSPTGPSSSSLTDDERERVMHCVLEHVAGRVPVIVTTTHFGTQLCAERSRRAQARRRRDGDGHAALPRRDHPGAGARRSTSSSAACRTRSRIPIMIQDAPVAGTPLSVPRSSRAWRARSRTSRYFKIEVPQAAAKLRALIAQGGDADRRPVGRRGRHHADGRSRRRRDRHDDRRRLSRTASARSSIRTSPATARRPRRPMSAGCR